MLGGPGPVGQRGHRFIIELSDLDEAPAGIPQDPHRWSLDDPQTALPWSPDAQIICHVVGPDHAAAVLTELESEARATRTLGGEAYESAQDGAAVPYSEGEEGCEKAL
jgi:hypothetical protein